jgi:hypothetical protein
MKSKISPRLIVLACFILSAGIYRLFLASGTLSPLANFTPLGAMALFGGCYFQDKWKAYLLPLITLWISDILLNRFIYFHEWILFYDGAIWVYSSFALIVMIGGFIKRVSIKNVVLAGVAGAVVHWIVSDIGMWLNGGTDLMGVPFTRNWQGLWECLYLAIPLMRNMIVGDLIFGAIFFGTFELMQRRFPILQHQQPIQS